MSTNFRYGRTLGLIGPTLETWFGGRFPKTYSKFPPSVYPSDREDRERREAWVRQNSRPRIYTGYFTIFNVHHDAQVVTCP